MDRECEVNKCFDFLKTQSERTDKINKWLLFIVVIILIVSCTVTSIVVISCNKTMQTMTTEYFGYDNPPIEAIQEDAEKNQSIKIGGEK